MKPFYSDSKHLEFSKFIRAALSLPFVPLDRLNEAMDILTKLVKTIKNKKPQKFSKQFLKYIKKHWIESKTYPPETWNFFKPDIKVSTNNYAEGYNSRLNRKKKLGQHPNVYLFASVIKDELEEGADDAIQASSGISIKKKRKKFVEMFKRKEKLMEDIMERNIKLIDYMEAIGGLNAKFDKRSKLAGIYDI